MDFFVIFCGLGDMSNDSGAFSVTFVSLLGVIYFMIALYFIGWVFTVRMQLPDWAQSQVMMGLLGLFKNLTLALNEKYDEVNPGKRQAEEQKQAAQKPAQQQQQPQTKPGASPGKPQAGQDPRRSAGGQDPRRSAGGDERRSAGGDERRSAGGRGEDPRRRGR